MSLFSTRPLRMAVALALPIILVGCVGDASPSPSVPTSGVPSASAEHSEQPTLAPSPEPSVSPELNSSPEPSVQTSGSPEPVDTTSQMPTPDSEESVPPVYVPSPSATGAPAVVPSREIETKEVQMEEAADLQGVAVEVVKLESVEGEATGFGEVAGPAVRVTVTVTNNTSTPVPLDGALVNLYYGADKAPAGEMSGPGADPLSGMVEPGATATGVNVFGVPRDARDKIIVEVFVSVDVPMLQFVGEA